MLSKYLTKYSIPLFHNRSARRYITKWEGQPTLPYLNNEDYLKVLETHVLTQPQRKILLVWGARSVSKSEGLKIKTAEWRQRGHTVIDIDLKGVPPTYQNFRAQFSQAIQDANLQITHKERNVVLKDLKQRLDEERAKMKASGVRLPIDKNERSLIETIGDAIGTFVFSILGIPVYNFGQLAGSVMKWTKGTSAPQTVEDFIALFRLLEIHANSAKKPPIIIWREIQNLAELRDAPTDKWPQDLYHRLFIHFEPRKQGTSRVPFIFESSDLLWARVQTTVSRESFSPYLLDQFTQGSAEKLLVGTTLHGFKEPVFTQDEFKIVWEYSGGHQGTIYILHNRLREGQTLSKALEDLKRQDFARLVGSINEVNPLEIDNKKEIVKKRDELLVQLHKAQYSLYIKDINEHPAALHLVNKNILFTDGKTVQPQYRAVELAIREYIKLTKLVSE